MGGVGDARVYVDDGGGDDLTPHAIDEEDCWAVECPKKGHVMSDFIERLWCSSLPGKAHHAVNADKC